MQDLILQLLHLHEAAVANTTPPPHPPHHPGSRPDCPTVLPKPQNHQPGVEGLRDGLHRPHVDHRVERSRGLGGAAHPALGEPVDAPGLFVAALRHTGTADRSGWVFWGLDTRQLWKSFSLPAVRGPEGVPGGGPASAPLPADAQLEAHVQICQKSVSACKHDRM